MPSSHGLFIRWQNNHHHNMRNSVQQKQIISRKWQKWPNLFIYHLLSIEHMHHCTSSKCISFPNKIIFVMWWETAAPSSSRLTGNWHKCLTCGWLIVEKPENELKLQLPVVAYTSWRCSSLIKITGPQVQPWTLFHHLTFDPHSSNFTSFFISH